jgi:hypothetical protein
LVKKLTAFSLPCTQDIDEVCSETNSNMSFTECFTSIKLNM